MRNCALLVLAVAAVAASLPAAAVAKPGYVVHSGGFELTVPLSKHDGASYSISASDHHHVELQVSRGGAFTTYKVEGRASSQGVHANFGRLGRIDLKIDLNGSEPLPFPPLPGCKGRRPAFLTGRFHGSVRFNGEGELGSFVAHGGPVGVERDFKTVCKKPRRRRHPHRSHPKGKGNDQIEIDLLFAKSHSKARKVEFLVLNAASRSKPSLSFAFVITEVSEQLGRVQISRSAVEIADHVLTFSKPGATPETALVKPPKPFLGSATYSADPVADPTWSGNLRVPLPGAGEVPLAGPEFRAKLCRSASESALEHCFHGSGSPSRPLAESTFSPPLISFRDDFFHRFLTHTH